MPPRVEYAEKSGPIVRQCKLTRVIADDINSRTYVPYTPTTQTSCWLVSEGLREGQIVILAEHQGFIWVVSEIKSPPKLLSELKLKRNVTN